MGKLNRHNLAIARLVSSVESRYVLSAIQITPDATLETDGQQALIVSTVPNGADDSAETFKPFLLPRSLALKLAKDMPATNIAARSFKPGKRGLSRATKKPPKLAVSPDVNGSATIEFGTDDVSSTIRVKQIGTFPDVQRVLNEAEKNPATFTICFTPKLLADLLAVIATMTDGVTMRLSTPYTPVILSGKNHATGQTITGVIMPRRSID